MNKKNKPLLVISTICLVMGAFVYLVLSSAGESMVYYKTVDELLNDTGRFAGQSIRVNGALVPDSLRQKPGTDQYRFKVSKRGKIMEVAYAGVLPDAMGDGQDVIVHGIFSEKKNIFSATEILTKCPSKYEAKAQSIAP